MHHWLRDMLDQYIRDFDIMPWADAATCDAYEALVDEMNERSDTNDGDDDFFGRVAEMALRLATEGDTVLPYNPAEVTANVD